ncbi:LysR family transcriptional regulator [Inquilinus limosus]|uniref:LysR family transcriptional regulator n=1 Tax=Inquilinus limosus MP06 TaxID=1398085 RepID=A0A0A0CZ43_9PROT|nr:LysR family transcriptional regulator [Inquilinus limosus]KGM31019.1 LysR family transcriptional regulator [Inquilinus limosus MP06]
MLNLNDLILFVRAVDAGGFAAAARRLGLPKSTISKRVAELEAALGARLIHRTSRSFVLTELGRDFYDHAQAAMIEAEAAEGVVRRRLAEPSGTVRITASVPTAQFRLAGLLPALARAYPKIRLQLHVTDRFVDLVQEGFDIAVRSHFAPLPDSELLQRRMGVERIALVAAPDYLARRGTPAEPADLAEHDGLLTGPSVTVWRLRHRDGPEEQVAPVSSFVADESVVLRQAAVAGIGVACLPETMTAEARAAGTLMPVLPEWAAGTVWTTLLTPHRRGQLPAVRAVIDFLVKEAA